MREKSSGKILRRQIENFLSIGVQGVQTRLKRNVRFESK